MVGMMMMVMVMMMMLTMMMMMVSRMTTVVMEIAEAVLLKTLACLQPPTNPANAY